MPRSEIIERIGRHKISAIIRTKDQSQAEEAIKAAVAGGFRLVEFTLTTPGALELIAQFAADSRLTVGAGTVMTADDADHAVAAGARFLVSPITDAAVIRQAHDLDVPMIPGAATPTEMETAHRAGADLIKLFPEPHDVAGFITAVRGPLPHLRIYPTAGVTPENVIDVLRAGAFGAGFVRSLFTPDDMARRDFRAIERRAADVVKRVAEMSS